MLRRTAAAFVSSASLRRRRICLASASARPVFVGIFVANFVGESTVDKVSDKDSDKGRFSKGGAKQILGGGLRASQFALDVEGRRGGAGFFTGVAVQRTARGKTLASGRGCRE